MVQILAALDIDLAQILRTAKTIAVVGLSPKPARPSYQVAEYLQRAGYTIIPVNPGHEQILGQRCYPNLESIRQPIDIVDIFRNPQEVPAIVDSAIAIGAKVVWMQLGIIHEEAAAKAKQAGMTVIMDRCLKIDHQNHH
ncbi:MAG: CoA-binding protein [Desulfobulbaceae bacterium]|nr:CoA-binding protein [Desulfobulbaceae bacterium]